VVTRLLVLALLGCSSNKARSGEDAKPTRADGAVVPSDGAPLPTAEAAIRVEWKAVTTAARTSPGRTACKTPRAASVAPTTMWGIPEAIVMVEGATATAGGEARITLSDCTLSPRIVVGTTLVVESALDRPAKLALAKHGTIGDLATLKAGEPRAIQLPIAGHAVSIALEPNAVYQLVIDAESEPAWIVAAPATITDAGGLATVRAPVGSHAVTAWLPARGGQPARLAKAAVALDVAQLVELVVDLGP
jgi:hypothetical protein